MTLPTAAPSTSSNLASADEPAVRVRGLRKRYGAVEAVRGVDLEIRRGEIFALLGPNGAGKTTTLEVLEGF
ncbi:MAG TPA: ATP-binding cassette domain-containing protein, partial [Solirubrobacteraceae bacterium]|nr:ATP-binding cassette domain-containing protein [Solirubrobacteraceae bacterium]